jgi:hypothetical protein
MTFARIRSAPWTCQWGRFGVTTEDLGLAGSRVDDVFWACHHPRRGPHVSIVARDECARCQFWKEADRLQTRG